MLAYAKEASHHTSVNRTIASPFDTIFGLLGELTFGQPDFWCASSVNEKCNTGFVAGLVR